PRRHARRRRGRSPAPPAAWRHVHPQRPVHGRHTPSGRDPRLAYGGRLRRHARAPRRRRRLRAREHAGRLADARGGGRRHPAVTVAGDGIEIDFAGTDPQHDGNLNCPLSVTRSACFFVVRCVTDPDVPASGGAFAPVTVRAPAGSLVNARSPAAVAAGNVETSCRIVDVVFAAFGRAFDVPAQGQGTMNNVTLGNDRFTYYETIGGGQGA